MRSVFVTEKLVAIGTVLTVAAFSTVFWAAPAIAQTNLPPVAAPTTSVSVNSLPMILSESQQVTDYVRGLVGGMADLEDVSGIIVIVSQDRVDMAEGFGFLSEHSEDDPIAIGSIGDVFAVVSAMQLVQRGAILPEEDIANALGETEPRGVTFEDLLTQRVSGLGTVIPQIIENATSMSYPDWVDQQIFQPLGITESYYVADNGNGFLVSPREMGRFLIALANYGEADGATILLPSTVELMMRRHRSNHPALPGWAYGFAEMQRNGWRAMQRDGTGVFQGTRMVIIPELRVAYFIAATGADAEFWDVLDNNLFDRLASPRGNDAIAASGTPPDATAASVASGAYNLIEAESEALFVKAGARSIRVEVDGSALRLTGEYEIPFLPEPGGIWRSEFDGTPAAFDGGVLQLGEFAYVKARPLISAGAYLAFAGAFSFLAVAFAAGGLLVPSLAGHEPKRGRELAFGLAGLTAILALTAAALRLTV